ncbi:Glycosyltransferase involved in cell wall bisynthesis [Glycomyces sambucus]|uniref:Glycosyltransferase involved in cell wall bisynthesis n=1 Tax=Glycomyces sambucus TaxID=380244 RepID=A0A1G9GPG4_9ACTN|nr:glycosyltransferase [Glycomyces sambucus]SDL02554.1 Glycosyltransferase involved in cell wall bisynthesis [Glycomyces sambucus]
MAADRPRLLYLAYYFPPSRASGVYRARATANYFAEAGWDVTVARAPDRFFTDVVGSLDESLVATVDPRITTVQPDLDFFPWETDVRRFGPLRGNFPFLAKRLHRWRQRLAFPDAYHSWGDAAVEEGLRLHRERPFDLVVATGNPFASFAAAYRLGKRTGLPYVVDYRDSWTLDLFANADAFGPGHRAWGWERRILGGAAGALFVNEALRAWHAERYPEAAERMRVVLNGWDPDVLAEEPDPRPRDDAPLSYAYVGTITKVQPVKPLFEGFQRMTAAGRHPGARLDLYGHLGFFAGSRAALAAEFGLGEAEPDGIAYRGPVAKAEIGRAYADSDVLVFLAGGSKYVTSGKIFEYMATGKPVVSVHERGCAAEELLADYPLWFAPGSLDPEDVARAMAEAGDAARKTDPETAAEARAYAASFTRYRALEPFEAWCRDLAARGGRR